MLNNPLIAFANSYDMQIEDEYAFGKIGNYLVSVYSNGSKKTAHISCCLPTEDSDEEGEFNTFKLSAEINKLIDSGIIALKDFELRCDAVVFSTGAELKDFDKAVTAVTELLAESGVGGTEFCIDCGCTVGENAKFVIEDSNAHVMCGNCAEVYLEKISAENAKKTESKYLKGTIFASLGGLLGLIISTLAFWIFIPTGEFLIFDSTLILSAAFGSVITVLSFLFYRIFTGRKYLERILPCLLVSVFMSSVGVYAASVILYAKTMSATTLSALSRAFSTIALSPFKDPYFKADFTSHIFYCMVVIIIVVLIYSIVFEDRRKTNLKVVPRAASAIADFSSEELNEELSEEVEEEEASEE